MPDWETSCKKHYVLDAGAQKTVHLDQNQKYIHLNDTGSSLKTAKTQSKAVKIWNHQH